MSKKKTCGPRNDPGADESRDYEVGYGKPPVHSQWRPGQSGNMRGRPKSSLNLQSIAAMLADELAEEVSVQGTDGKRKISKQQAFFKKLTNDGLTGAARDKKLLLEAMFRLAVAQASADEGAADEAVPSAVDALQRYVEREVRRRTLPDGGSEDDDEEGSP